MLDLTRYSLGIARCYLGDPFTTPVDLCGVWTVRSLWPPQRAEGRHGTHFGGRDRWGWHAGDGWGWLRIVDDGSG